MRFVLAPIAATAVILGFQTTAVATVRIRIDLGAQRMHVSSRAGEFDWAVSTGRAGHRTPTGVFHPQRMYAMVHSAKYDNAPMPHSIFFTGGYAIHGSAAVGLLGQPASHGCVRLAPGHAAALYDMVRRESATIVIDGAPDIAARERLDRDPDSATAAVKQEGSAIPSESLSEDASFEMSLPAADVKTADPRAGMRESHRAGHRLAAQWRKHYRDGALAYMPQRRLTARSLRDWADNPLENQ